MSVRVSTPTTCPPPAGSALTTGKRRKPCCAISRIARPTPIPAIIHSQTPTSRRSVGHRASTNRRAVCHNTKCQVDARQPHAGCGQVGNCSAEQPQTSKPDSQAQAGQRAGDGNAELGAGAGRLPPDLRHPTKTVNLNPDVLNHVELLKQFYWFETI